jgi:hypothetical protein
MHVLKLHAFALHDEARSIEIYGGDSDAIQTRRRALRAGSLALDALAKVDDAILFRLADEYDRKVDEHNRAGRYDSACVCEVSADAIRRNAEALRDALDRIRADERA